MFLGALAFSGCTPEPVSPVQDSAEVAPSLSAPPGAIGDRCWDKTETPAASPPQVRWVELVCPEDQTPEFVATLQRALAARGDYAGEITGKIGPQTEAAIARYQARSGTGGTALSTESAARLGLISRQPAL
jgi:hypothetical protein